MCLLRVSSINVLLSYRIFRYHPMKMERFLEDSIENKRTFLLYFVYIVECQTGEINGIINNKYSCALAKQLLS